MDGLAAKVEALDKRLGGVEADLRGLRGDVSGIIGRLGSIEGKLDVLTRVTDKIPSGWAILGIMISTLVAVPSILGVLVLLGRHLQLLPPGP